MAGVVLGPPLSMLFCRNSIREGIIEFIIIINSIMLRLIIISHARHVSPFYIDLYLGNGLATGYFYIPVTVCAYYSTDDNGRPDSARYEPNESG